MNRFLEQTFLSPTHESLLTVRTKECLFNAFVYMFFINFFQASCLSTGLLDILLYKNYPSVYQVDIPLKVVDETRHTHKHPHIYALFSHIPQPSGGEETGFPVCPNCVVGQSRSRDQDRAHFCIRAQLHKLVYPCHFIYRLSPSPHQI